ncbi:hypothetical protein SDC9_76150 [bioreactor metagenome]|uniref:Uncharacterized protein n=1 Tax=bioreactor metagenome TaxID=1076179 RepID=A0A644YMF6_9ZZZZ
MASPLAAPVSSLISTALDVPRACEDDPMPIPLATLLFIFPNFITAGATAAPTIPVITTDAIVIASLPPRSFVDSTAIGFVIDFDNSDNNIVFSILNNRHKIITEANDVIILATTPPAIGIRFFLSSYLFL